MKFSTLTSVAIAVLSGLTSVSADAVRPDLAANAYPFERLDQNNSVLLIVDMQVGLYTGLARDFEFDNYFRNTLAHAAIGKLFPIPVIITTSVESGPNGPIPDEIKQMYPNHTIISRSGEIDAWDNPEFRAAVEATGRTQMIMAGISTDVCTTLLALSLRDAGYSVWANVEASGTFSQIVRETANARMASAGVHLTTIGTIVADLMRDWRNPSPGFANFGPWVTKYVPSAYFYGRLFNAAQAEALNQTGAA